MCYRYNLFGSEFWSPASPRAPRLRVTLRLIAIAVAALALGAAVLAFAGCATPPAFDPTEAWPHLGWEETA